VRLAALALVLALAGCASTPGLAIPAWQAPLGREHPLTGRVWDVAAARFIEPRLLASRLAGARFVLLGEKHDNADHHQLQAALVRGLIADGRRPAVAFEMLDAGQRAALARHLAAAPRDAAGLGDAVGWKESGWPPWPVYEPIAQAALDAGLPVLAANVPPDIIRSVARGDSSRLPGSLVASHALDRPLAGPAQAAMAAEIRDAHCGHGNDGMVTGMIAAQRARDAQMAETLLTGAGDGGVLIAGAGHVRNDRAVPAYLRARAPAATIASVAFLEVQRGVEAPADYAARFGEGRIPFDYIWFTPRMDDDDPCETFRRSFERLRR
jgi:uncharacterized iron-regulated protein